MNIRFPFEPDNNTRIIYLDATGFKESGCLQKMYNIIVAGLREKNEASWFAFGSALHKFVAHGRTTGKITEALTQAITSYMPTSLSLKDNDFRTLPNLILACNMYAKQVMASDSFQTMQDVDGKPLIEQKFAFPATEIFPEMLEMFKRYNIIVVLCGTVDEIGVIDGENITIKDIKTKSMYPKYVDLNIQQYFKTYALSIQLMFYVMITEHLLGLKNVGAFIDGVFFIKLPENKVQIKFSRSEIFFFDVAKRNMFTAQLKRVIYDLCDSIHNNIISQNYALCDSSRFASDKVGQCPFFNICSAPDDELRLLYTNRDFKIQQWEPLKFGEFTQ